MVRRNKYCRQILSALRSIDDKCEKIICVLEAMRGMATDSMLESIRESARDIYESSIAERRRVGRLFDTLKHD